MHHTHHDPVFVALSIVIAVLGSWTALDLFHRAAQHVGRSRTGWLTAASLAMGTSIWSMHFVAMLGFDPGSSVSYDPALTAVSLLLALGSTAGAFFFVSLDKPGLRRTIAGGVLMGAGICAMHYVGMAALKTAVSLGYDFSLVALSFIIAVLASTTALSIASKERSANTQLVASVILGLAVVGMHYTAMAALKLTYVPDAAVGPPGAPPLVLAVCVAALTILMMFLAIMASLYDQRGNVLSALEAGAVGYWEMDLKTKALRISPRGKLIFGLSPDQDVSYSEALSRIAPDSRLERERQLAHAISTNSIYDIEYPLSANGRWVNARGRVVNSRNGRPVRMVGVVLDVTDRREAFRELEVAERRQRLLIDELNHRVKNTLATVQSISRQTARQSTSIERFHADFEARILALSATHNALTRGGWEQASLQEILENELKPYGANQVRLIGIDIQLQARPALAVGMVLHELATNAAKHGCLAVPAGLLTVRWFLEERGSQNLLHVEWDETGAQILEVPSRKGFGSRLVRSSIENELGGQIATDFRLDGLRCAISFPIQPVIDLV